MIRNSDVLFGRTAAAYRFADREVIRQVMKEVSSLQVLGIDKRMPQIMYERGFLNEDQIGAVMESLFVSHRIKRIRGLVSYVFTEEDDRKFLEYLGFSEWPQGPIVETPDALKGKKLPISYENLVLCLNIKQSLEKACIKTTLMNVIADKKLLNSRFKEIFPDLAQKRKAIVATEEMDERKKRRNIAVLLGQIAMINGKLSLEQFTRSLNIWEAVIDLEVDLRYSELLFYMGAADERGIARMASLLANLSEIDQSPRFPLLRLTEEEQRFFERLVEKGEIAPDILEKGSRLLERLQEEGLCAIRISDILILKGYLSRKDISQKWTNLRKREAESAVKRLEIEKTEEAMVDYEKMKREIEDSEHAAQRVEDDEKKYQEDTRQIAREILLEAQDADDFEKELDHTFRTTREERRKAIHEEVKQLKDRLKTADRKQAKTINTVIQHYQKSKSMVIFYLAIVLVFFGTMMAGVLWPQKAQEQKGISRPDSGEKTPKPGPRKEEIVKKEMARAEQFKKNYQLQQALEIYKKVQQEFSDAFSPEFRASLENLELQSRLFEALGNIVRQTQPPLSFTFRGREKSYLSQTFPDGVILHLSQGQTSLKVTWQELAPVEIYGILSSHGLLSLFPWEMALFCAEHDLVEEMRESLGKYLQKFPQQKEKAWKLFGAARKERIPANGYVVYAGKLYTSEEVDRLSHETKEPGLPESEGHSQPVGEKEWEALTKIETQQLLVLRNEYAKERQMEGALFKNERWTSGAISEYEDVFQRERREGKIFFQGKWSIPDALGTWHDVLLKKGPKRVSGFLLPIKGIYEFRTGDEVLYLKDADILEKRGKPYPLEAYWKKREISRGNVLAEMLLARWCQDHRLDIPAQIQFEQALMLSPRLPRARKEMGYFWNGRQWSSKEKDATKDYLLLKGRPISREKAERCGIVAGNPPLFLEEVALRKFQEENSERPDLGEMALRIFKGAASPVKENRWTVRYPFDVPLDRDIWNYGDFASVQSGNLEVEARGEVPGYVYLKVPWMGDLTARFHVMFPQTSNRNMMFRLFKDPAEDSHDGYLICLNWSDPVSPERGMSHIVRVSKGDRSKLLDVSSGPILAPNRQARVTIRVGGEKLEVYLERERIFSVEEKSFRLGWIGLGTFRNRISCDEISITGQIEPSWYEKMKESRKDPKEGKTYEGVPSALLQKMEALPVDVLELWKEGRVHGIHGNEGLAWECLEKGTERAPEFPFFWLEKGTCCLLKNEMEEAERNFAKATILAPEFNLPLLGKGELFRKRKKYREALESGRQALGLNLSDIRPYYMLAKLFLETGNAEEAISIAKDARSRMPLLKSAEGLLEAVERVVRGPLKETSFKISTPHYVVLGDCDPSYGRAVSMWLEKMYAHCASLGELNLQKKLKVVLFKKRADFCEYLALEEPADTNGWTCKWWPVTSELVGSVDQHPQTWKSELFAASAEQIYENVGLPSFLREGLVSYFSFTKIDDGQLSWEIPPFLGAEIKRESDEISLEKWLSFNPRFSLQGYAWTHFFMHGGKGKYLDILKEYRSLLDHGSDVQSANQKVFPSDKIEWLNKACREYWSEKNF